MCLICVELQQNRLTTNEARRNLREVSTAFLTAEEKAHVDDVERFIEEKEFQQMRFDEVHCQGGD